MPEPRSGGTIVSPMVREKAPDWGDLAGRVRGRLVTVEPSLTACYLDPSGPACTAALSSHRNPFFVEDEAGAFQTTGWLDAFVSEPSAYAVAVESSGDIASAVAFAHEHGTRLVVKGTGHDYLGRSAARDSLLVWTHNMREIVVHDAFVPTGAPAGSGVPAITLGAGTRWLEAYQALAPLGRFVQGGGCTSVGAAGGFTQGGGFGSFSKRFGTAAGNVLEMEAVTAGGDVLIVNELRHSDLFWALRGGGGGTFAIVSNVTFKTHPMPSTIGVMAGTIRASSAESYRLLVRELVRLFPDLDNEHWGEQIRFGPDDTVELSMTVLDLGDDEAQAVWQPLLDWIDESPEEFASDAFVASVPFSGFWDPHSWEELAPDMIRRDDRPGQPGELYWWATNQREVSQYIDAYQSRWLPLVAFSEEPDVLAEALFAASRHHHFSIHANKGLSGAAPDVLAQDRRTSINPVAFDAAGLVIMVSTQPETYPGVRGHEPDRAASLVRARQVSEGMAQLRAVTPGSGSYVNEADYFEPDWQHSFWGANYPRLLDVKQRYDPANLLRVHHGVGSDR